MRAGLSLVVLTAWLALARCVQAASIGIGYIGVAAAPAAGPTLLEPSVTDEGVAGARLALEDDRTTGRFLDQDFSLEEDVAADPAAALEAAKRMHAAGLRLFVLDLPASTLLQVADLAEMRDSLLLDATSADDRLRGADCRSGVLHLLPSRAMLADALMQYLAVKRWRDVLLVAGPAEADHAFADALRRAAPKFQIRLVADKDWTFAPGAQRTDTGHVTIAAEAARFTQAISYDVLVVADTQNAFGADLAYRTTAPRPVAGTHGLVPTAWAAPFQQWGATQLQSRFLRLAHRWMTAKDYGAWMAVRAVGEAATRSRSADPAVIAGFMRGPHFALAAFKGRRLQFRPWDGQLRQPVLLVDADSLVSVSPQPGFLHQVSELDTLGTDQPETACQR